MEYTREKIRKYMKENNVTSYRTLSNLFYYKNINISYRTLNNFDLGLDVSKSTLDKVNAFLNFKEEQYKGKIIERDLVNLQRRKIRDETRFFNNFEELLKGISEEFGSDFDLKKKKEYKGTEEIIITLGDCHFGIGTDDVKCNISSYLNKIKEQIYRNDVARINLFLLGDLVNLDYHMDKLHSFDMSRGKAVYEAFMCIKKFIDELSNYASVRVYSVPGNESRMTKDFSAKDSLGWDNLDTMIFQMIKACYDSDPDVNVVGEGNDLSNVIVIKNKNFLVTHGYFFRQNSLRDDISKMRLMYWEEKGLKIDYTILGHYHHTRIENRFAISGAMANPDEYAKRVLKINDCKPSGMIIVVGDEITPMPVFF